MSTAAQRRALVPSAVILTWTTTVDVTYRMEVPFEQLSDGTKLEFLSGFESFETDSILPELEERERIMTEAVTDRSVFSIVEAPSPF